MKIAYIAAGAGGMYCGSCIHDNALSTALRGLGHDVVLLPTYTPIRTDEEDMSSRRVFYGAVNVYLESKSALYRRLPRSLGRILDWPALLGWVTRLAASTDARELGALTLDVINGENGPQLEELEQLVSWLASEHRPQVVQITNSLLIGLARRMKRDLDAAVVVTLQGEDLFLDELPEPYRGRAIDEMRRRAAEVDAFIAPSHYYADFMGELLELPADRLHVVPLGLTLDGHRRPLTLPQAGRSLRLGFLGRISPEKGFGILVDAFAELAAEPGHETLELHAAGYLGGKDRRFFERLTRKISEAGLADRFRYHGELDREAKIDFLRSLDLFSVPTVYREPKGLSVLEAMANGVPVVQPHHGSFPEMLAATGGGLLVEPNSAAALAAGLATLLDDAGERRRLGDRGRAAVLERFGVDRTAEATVEVYRSAVAARASSP